MNSICKDIWLILTKQFVKYVVAIESLEREYPISHFRLHFDFLQFWLFQLCVEYYLYFNVSLLGYLY